MIEYKIEDEIQKITEEFHIQGLMEYPAFKHRLLTLIQEERRDAMKQGAIDFVLWNKEFEFDENGGYDIQEALEGVDAYFKLLDSKLEEYLKERR